MELIDDNGNRHHLSALGAEVLAEVCRQAEWAHTQHAMNLEQRGIRDSEARRLRTKALACRQLANMLRGGDPFARPSLQESICIECEKTIYRFPDGWAHSLGIVTCELPRVAMATPPAVMDVPPLGESIPEPSVPMSREHTDKILMMRAGRR